MAKWGLTILEVFYLQKHFLENISKEKYWSEDKQQLSFKYFVKFRFIHKLLSKVGDKQTIPSREHLSVNGLTWRMYCSYSCLLDDATGGQAGTLNH